MALCLPGTRPRPPDPACPPTPRLTADPRGTPPAAGDPGVQGRPQGPSQPGGGGPPADRRRPPQGSRSLGEPGSRPFLTTLTSALWKQLLLEGLSISLFLQEINTPHKVNGGFRQGAFTSFLTVRAWALLGANDRSADTRQTVGKRGGEAGAAGRRGGRGRAWRPSAVLTSPPGAGVRSGRGARGRAGRDPRALLVGKSTGAREGLASPRKGMT